MKIFKLPDLGEGLPDAIIREWYIKAGDAVKKDQPLVSMETAKALVDVPAPFDGKIEQSNQTLTNDIYFSERESTETPAMRARARKLNAGAAENLSEGYEKLSGIKRAMVISMQQSHRDIVPVTLIDDADISKWVEKQDITVRIIRAIINACKIEPALNAHFNGNNMSVKKFSEINLGMAVDMPHGLYVQVIKNVAALSDLEIRTAVDRYKQQAQTKSLSQNDLHGATIV